MVILSFFFLFSRSPSYSRFSSAVTDVLIDWSSLSPVNVLVFHSPPPLDSPDLLDHRCHRTWHQLLPVLLFEYPVAHVRRRVARPLVVRHCLYLEPLLLQEPGGKAVVGEDDVEWWDGGLQDRRPEGVRHGVSYRYGHPFRGLYAVRVQGRLDH